MKVHNFVWLTCSMFMLLVQPSYAIDCAPPENRSACVNIAEVSCVYYGVSNRTGTLGWDVAAHMLGMMEKYDIKRDTLILDEFIEHADVILNRRDRNLTDCTELADNPVWSRYLSKPGSRTVI